MLSEISPPKAWLGVFLSFFSSGNMGRGLMGVEKGEAGFGLIMLGCELSHNPSSGYVEQGWMMMMMVLCHIVKTTSSGMVVFSPK